MASSTPKASVVVSSLSLKAHPEGGFYSETFRDSSITLSRSQLPSQYILRKSRDGFIINSDDDFTQKSCQCFLAL